MGYYIAKPYVELLINAFNAHEFIHNFTIYSTGWYEKESYTGPKTIARI